MSRKRPAKQISAPPPPAPVTVRLEVVGQTPAPPVTAITADTLRNLANTAAAEGNREAAKYLESLAEQAGAGELPAEPKKPLQELFGDILPTGDASKAWNDLFGPTGTLFDGPDNEGEEFVEIAKSSAAANADEPVAVPRRFSQILARFGAYTGIKDPRSVTGVYTKMLTATALIPPIWACINTRAQQVCEYANYSEDPHKPGWRFVTSDPNMALTPELLELRSRLIDLVQYGGFPRKADGSLRRNPVTGEIGVWSGVTADGDYERALPFDQYLQAGTEAMLTYDSFAVRTEYGRDREQFPVVFCSPADSARIWPAVPSGPYARTPQIDPHLKHVQWVEVSADDANSVLREFDYSTMDVLVRRPRLDYYSRGFGRSEVEICLELAQMLWHAVDFEASYFDKNSLPAGILEIVGQVMNNRGASEELKRQIGRVAQGGNPWKWKMLLLNLASDKPGAGIKFHNIRGQSGGTAELALIEPWFNFLFNIICAVFTMNSEEVGFSAVKVGGPSLSQGGQEITLEHSKHKGLYPILHAHAALINRQRRRPYDPDDLFVFEFTGMQEQDKVKTEEYKRNRQGRGYTLNQIRDESDEEPVKVPVLPQFYTTIEEKTDRSKAATPADWRRKVNDAYAKAYWKVVLARWEKENGHPPDEIEKAALEMTMSPWCDYPDAPTLDPAALGLYQAQKQAVYGLLSPQMQPPAMDQPGQEGGQPGGQGQPAYDPNDPWGHGAGQAQSAADEEAPDDNGDSETQDGDSDEGDDATQPLPPTVQTVSKALRAPPANFFARLVRGE